MFWCYPVKISSTCVQSKATMIFPSIYIPLVWLYTFNMHLSMSCVCICSLLTRFNLYKCSFTMLFAIWTVYTCNGNGIDWIISVFHGLHNVHGHRSIKHEITFGFLYMLDFIFSIKKKPNHYYTEVPLTNAYSILNKLTFNL